MSSSLGAPTGLSDVRWTRTTVGGPNYLGGSVIGVAGIVRSTCAGGCSRRRRLFRPNHGDLVQSNGTVSFTGRRRDYVHKESENGSVDYPVHALRRGCELRRPWTGLSGEADFDSSLGELHRGVLTRLRGLDRGREGLGWPVYGGRGFGGRGHAAHRQTTVS